MSNNKFGGPFLPFPRWAMKSLVGDTVAMGVLLQMLMFMNPDNQTTTTSYEYIASQIGVDRRTVIRAVKRLESVGVLVKKTRKKTDGNGNLSNLYVIKFDSPEVFEVVSPETLGSVTSDTRGSDTRDTRVVSPVSPNQEYKNKSKNKSIRTKKPTSGYEDLKVDERI
jgi:biotin operon repressor